MSKITRTWIVHVIDTNELFVTHTNELCRTYYMRWVVSHWWNESCCTHESVMPQTQMSNAAWGTYAWVVSHTHEGIKPYWWTIHVTHMDQSCHGYEWVMPHRSHMNVSCHAQKGVMSCSWRSHGTHMNSSCHRRGWCRTHFVCATGLISQQDSFRVCNRIHFVCAIDVIWYVQQDSFRECNRTRILVNMSNW